MKTLMKNERKKLRDELSTKFLDELAARMEDQMWKSATIRGDNEYNEDDKTKAVERITKQIFGSKNFGI